MSGLDYTKNEELGNTKPFTGIRSAIYTLVFLSRTRFEKWRLYLSLAFGVAGLGLILYLIQVINTPADIVISCDISEMKRALANQKAEQAIKKEEIPQKKTRKK